MYPMPKKIILIGHLLDQRFNENVDNLLAIGTDKTNKALHNLNCSDIFTTNNDINILTREEWECQNVLEKKVKI